MLLATLILSSKSIQPVLSSDIGKFGQVIDKFKVGDSVAVKGPIVKYEYKPNEYSHIGMIAGGSGITPMLQVARRALQDKNDKTKVSLIFGNVTEADIILKKELDRLALANPSRFSIHYILDKPTDSWKGLKGYITEPILKDIIPPPGPQSRVLVCGPPPMTSAISGPKAPDYSQGELSGLLLKMGYTKDMVFKY